MKELSRIKEQKDEDLRQELFYAIKLVGLSTDKLMKADIDILVDFLKTTYSNKKSGDIRKAFQFGVAEKLNDYGVEMRHFQTFDCLYVARILNGYYKLEAKLYLQDRSKGNADAAKQIGNTEAKSPEQDEDAYNRMFDQWNKGEIKMHLWRPAFRHAEDAGKIRIPNSKKKELYNDVKKKAESKLKAARMTGTNEMLARTELTDPVLKNTCSRICLEEYWKAL